METTTSHQTYPSLALLRAPIYLISIHPLLQTMISDACLFIQYRVEIFSNLEVARKRIEGDRVHHTYPAAVILDLSLDSTRELAFFLDCQRILQFPRCRTRTIILADPLHHIEKEQLGVHYLFLKPFAIRDFLCVFSLPLSF